MVRSFLVPSGARLLIARLNRYHYNLNSFQLTNLLFLARSMCVSFGFKDSQQYTTKSEHSSTCLEQMRAFAGCYYINTQ